MRCRFSVLLIITMASPSLAKVNPASSVASPLHGYVLGRAAYSGDALEDAARFFESAYSQDPQAPNLAQRAFELAVASGDRKRAFAMATDLHAKGKKNPELAIILLSDAVLKKDWAGAAAVKDDLSSAGYAAVAVPIIEAWIAFGRGDIQAALTRLDPSEFTGFTRSYIAEQRAHMLAASGRWAEAAAAYSALRASSPSGISFIRQGEADAVAQMGDRKKALAILDGNEPPTVAARERLLAGKRIGALAPDSRRGLSWMAARLAADLARDRPVPLALLFARTATFLAPEAPAGWLIVGDILARGRQREAALAAYAQVPAKDALEETAQARRADVLELLGRNMEAGVLLVEATEAEGAASDAWVRLADWHRRAERFAPAIAAYSRSIELTPDSANSWGLWFLRGSMKERAGDWPGAEVDFREALQRSPDEPVVLNYLGYSLLDRGSKLPEASKMIEKAASLRPADGGIVDSLGWSQYRQGQFAEAVITLEKAADLEPTDSTVSEHLGDAYWRTGRLIEARFRWRAAMSMEPDTKQRAGLLAKVDYGLDAALAMAN